MNYLTIDIGGTSIKSAIYEKEKFNDYYQIPINRNNPIKSLITCIIQYEPNRYDELLISATGVISKKGEVVNVNGILKNYLSVNIKNICEQEFEKKTIVINDVNAFSFSKSFNESTFYLTIGTGIGGAFRNKNQSILLGTTNAACELGQISYKNGILEEYVSTLGLINLANDKYNLNVESGKNFFEKLKLNDTYQLCLEEWVEDLTNCLCTICYLFNPSNIVIGGAISNQKSIIKPLIINKLSEKISEVYLKELKIYFIEEEKYAIFRGLINYQKNCT